jgi:hypothetical protein
MGVEVAFGVVVAAGVVAPLPPQAAKAMATTRAGSRRRNAAGEQRETRILTIKF